MLQDIPYSSLHLPIRGFLGQKMLLLQYGIFTVANWVLVDEGGAAKQRRAGFMTKTSPNTKIT